MDYNEDDSTEEKSFKMNDDEFNEDDSSDFNPENEMEEFGFHEEEDESF